MSGRRYPLAPLPDAPLHTRAEVRQHYADGPGRVPGAERFEAVGQVHETSDPEVVIFEFDYVGSANGGSFPLPCIFVTRVRDGVIVESRDYADHVGVARVSGQLENLATATGSPGPASRAAV